MGKESVNGPYLLCVSVYRFVVDLVYKTNENKFFA